MTDREKTATESSGKATSKRHKAAASEEVKAKFREALERKSAHGGTAAAAAELVRMQGGIVTAFSFLIELSFLHGMDRLKKYNAHVVNLITY